VEVRNAYISFEVWGGNYYTSRCFYATWYLCGWKTFNWQYKYWLVWVVSWIIRCHAWWCCSWWELTLIELVGFSICKYSWFYRQPRRAWKICLCLLTKAAQGCQWDICNFWETLESAALMHGELLFWVTFYREMCIIATDYNAKLIGGFTLLIQLWAWERCPTLAPSVIPPQQQNAPLAFRYTFLYYFELIINKYGWLMLIIILCNIFFVIYFFVKMVGRWISSHRQWQFTWFSS